MKTLRALSIFSAVGLALGVLGITAARADDCDLAKSAAIAQAKVPHAATHMTTIAGAAPTRAEMIFIADKAYLQKDGAWHSMSYSPQAQIDRINAVKTGAEKAKQTCQKAGSETIKGEAATVLVIHTDASGKKSDARVWISDKTGLLLKSEVRLDGGDEVAVITDDFRHDNIEAPAAVK